MGVEFEESYGIGSGTRLCSGIRIHENGLAKYLSDRVRKRHYGHDLISNMLEEFPDLRSTGFGNSRLVGTHSDPKPWQVGESFSECFFEDHKGARLPYPRWQDLKNQNTSQTGADLVGYDYQDGSAVFLFGEVKTSAQARRPPSVVSVLKEQLRDLGSSTTSRQLILWLGLKVMTQKNNQQDKQDFSQAVATYVKDVFKIVGVLIRDTVPDRRDLESAFAQLAAVLRQKINLEMLAIYLPIPIDEIPRMMEDGDAHG